MGPGWAPYLLTHVNLLLTLFGGAALATAARLKWDPSTYVALRELLPTEYRVAAATLTALGAALLLLPHLAALALHARSERLRRALLYLFAALMLCVCAVEAGFVAWMARRVLAWLASPAAEPFLDGIQLMEEIKPVLAILSRWHSLPRRIEEILEEVRADAPRNVYAGAAAGALLVLLQLGALVLAPLAARRAPPAPRHTLAQYSRTTSVDAPNIRYEKLPLRTAYKNGRIVVL